MSIFRTLLNLEKRNHMKNATPSSLSSISQHTICLLDLDALIHYIHHFVVHTTLAANATKRMHSCGTNEPQFASSHHGILHLNFVFACPSNMCLYRSLSFAAFNLCVYLSRVPNPQRDDGPAVGVGLQVRVTALGDPREQVTRLVCVCALRQRRLQTDSRETAR